ncbi:unnamed protein product [Parajaminaea phylloscopi]
MTPAEQQAAAVSRLLANPDREVKIPQPTREKQLRAPREMIKNVTGSSAGAGSGEFHVYKHARRREYERVKLLEERAEKEQETSSFLIQQAEQAARDDAKTNKNRNKRDKKKLARERAKLASQESTQAHVGSKRPAPDSAAGEKLSQNEKRMKAAPGSEAIKFQARATNDEDSGPE